MTTQKIVRPDLSAYFRDRIAWHTVGLLSGNRGFTIPHGVRVKGDVTDSLIIATMEDGTEWHWTAGRYAARKVNGCYAPLMPKPATLQPAEPLCAPLPSTTPAP